MINDLLPLPFTAEALLHTAARVRTVQDVLGRQILIENTSSYLDFAASHMSKWEFVAALAAESGCAILLDVNNLYVNAINHGFDARVYMSSVPSSAVQEIHLGGHSVACVGTGTLLIDAHAAPVCDAVWQLYALALERFGPVRFGARIRPTVRPVRSSILQAGRHACSCGAARTARNCMN